MTVAPKRSPSSSIGSPALRPTRTDNGSLMLRAASGARRLRSPKSDPAPAGSGPKHRRSRKWTRLAPTSCGGGCGGVLYARGSHNVGHAFFIKDGKLQFDYNALGTHYRAAGKVELKPGAHQIEARFEREERPGQLTVVVDGRDVGSAEVGTVADARLDGPWT
jgi:hypothetical protein